MPGNARCYDIWVGVCCCHVDPPCIPMAGPIITCSSDTLVNNIGQGRCTDTTIGFCGHPGVVVSCSSDGIDNNLGIARCGDAVSGCNIGSIVSCSGDTFTNG